MLKKFLVLKNTIVEDELLIKQQFFRRSKYKPLLNLILEYFKINELFPLLRLNKNIKNLIKEKQYLIYIPALRETLNEELKIVCKKKEGLKGFLSLTNNENLENRLNFSNYEQAKHIYIPIYFWQKYNPYIKGYVSYVNNITIGDFGAQLLAYCVKIMNLETLKFERIRSGLNNFFVNYYTKLCTDLKVLKISISDLNYKNELLLSIGTIKNLKEIEISYCKITSHTVQYICNSLIKGPAKVKKLTLNDCAIDDDSGDTLSNLIRKSPFIKYLNLQNNRINKHGLVAIGEAINVNSNLKQLNLNHNKIRDINAKAFFVNIFKGRPPKLKILNFTQNHLSKRSCKMIRKYLTRKDCSLEELYLEENKIELKDLEKLIIKLNSFSKLRLVKLSTIPNENNSLFALMERVNLERNLSIQLLKQLNV